ncbi:MAG: TolC family protein [Sphingomonas sp.]
MRRGVIGGGLIRQGMAGGAAGLVALLPACVAYHPVPMPTATLLARHDAQTVDPSAVRAAAIAIAPDAPHPAAGWDRLDYFVAIERYNPQVAVARAALATATANARAARTGQSPILTLTAEYAHDVTASSPWLIGGAIDIPLDTGGRRAARLASADLATLSARYDLAEAIWQARIAARRALAQRLIADRQQALLRVLAGYRDRQLTAAERRLNAGEIARGDVERVRADGANVIRRQRDAAASARGADAAIAAAVGVPAAAFTGINPLWADFDAPAETVPHVDAETRRVAILSRADVLKALADYQTAEADLRSEVAKQYPAFQISPGYTWERGLVKVPFALGLVLPPFDLNRRNIRAAEAKRVEAGKKLDAVVADAAAAVDAALIEARAARAALADVRAREVPVAQRLAVQADRAIAAGTIDRVDWAAAQAGAVEAQLAELDALARIHTADAALEDAVRRPLTGPETAIKAGGEGKTT